MTITTTLAACSQTVSSNGPDGAVDPPSALDDAIRYSLSFVAQLRDTKAAIGANSDITSLSGLTSINGGPLAGFRNRIINGDMRIDQRNSGAAVTLSSTISYAVDRMLSVNTTATGAVTAQQSTLNGAKSLLVTATAAVTDLTTIKNVTPIAQRFEAQNVFDLNGKTITVSFKVQTNWSGKLAVSFVNGGGAARSYVVDVNVISGTNNIAVSLPLEATTVIAQDNSIGLALTIGLNNAGTLQTSTTGSWLASAFYNSTLSTNWALTTGNYINVTEVQLEAGTVATPFERRPIGIELALCQRYYQRFTLPNGARYFAGFSTSTTILQCCLQFFTPMRIAPTSIETTGVATDYGIAYSNTANTCTSVPIFVNGSSNAMLINATTSAILTIGQGGNVYSNASGSTGFIGIPAEL